MQKIVWLEIHAPELMKLEHSILPEGYTIERPTSRTDREEHLRLLADADYIITAGIPLSKEYIYASKNLKMIQKWGIGVDKVDCEAARQRNIPVYITAGSNSIPVAELAMGLMLAASRRIPYVDKTVRDGLWIRNDMRAQCTMINGKTVGLFGIGNIAKRVAQMLSGFQCNVVYYDINRLSPQEEKERGVRYVEFEELIIGSDILSIHVPLTKSTRGIIGPAEFEKMKPSALLINTARGGVVNETAMIDALTTGKIRGTGLDAFEQEPINMDNPLLKLDNVVLTCHCGGGVVDNVLNVTRHAYRNIVAFSKGEVIDQKDVIVEVKK